MAKPAEQAQALRAGLIRLIAHEQPGAGDIEIAGLTRADGGISTETWLFDARWKAGAAPVERGLVLRCAPENEIVVATREDEFHLLRGIEGQGLLAPRAYWLDAQGSFLGRPAMVLERCPGRADRNLLNARNNLGLKPEEQLGLAHQLTDALAAIHRLDAGVVGKLPRSEGAGGNPARRELDRQEASLRREGMRASPEMRLAAAWLRDHLPGAPAREVLVHGDFRPANVLVAGGRITAVLDWELAHVGDPAEDLGWYLAPIYRNEHFIPGAWTAEDFLGRYEERSGLSADRRAVRFWSVFALFKLAGIIMNQTHAYAQGDLARIAPFPDHLIAALMRAVSTPEVAA